MALTTSLHRRRDHQRPGPFDDVPLRAGLGVDETSETRRRRAGPTGDTHDVRPRARDLDRDGVSGTPAADDEAVDTVEVDQLLRRPDEPDAVGVVTDPSGIGPNDTIDRPTDACGRSEIVDQLNHRLLVRGRAVESPPPHRVRTGDGSAELLFIDLTVHVSPIETLVGEACLHHRNGRVGRSAPTERTHHGGQEPHGSCLEVSNDRMPRSSHALAKRRDHRAERSCDRAASRKPGGSLGRRGPADRCLRRSLDDEVGPVTDRFDARGVRLVGPVDER